MVAINMEATRVLTGVPLGGEEWLQLGELGLALLLSACIGLERGIRQKNAGLRTYTLVGLGAALFMLVSKYGFSDVIEAQRIVLDPSRMAAQIVSGIGFIGAGLIFVRRDSVRGLTTAASVWVTAAIGSAAGAGLPVLAAVAAGAYLLIVALAFPALTRRLPRSPTAVSTLRVRYLDGKGVLRRLLQAVTAQGFTIDEVSADTASRHSAGPAILGTPDARPLVEVILQVHGRQPVKDLAATLSYVHDVDAVMVNDANAAPRVTSLRRDPGTPVPEERRRATQADAHGPPAALIPDAKVGPFRPVRGRSTSGSAGLPDAWRRLRAGRCTGRRSRRRSCSRGWICICGYLTCTGHRTGRRGDAVQVGRLQETGARRPAPSMRK
jgi:putative Mg2+ transporter-C (MgtC) family protein